MTPVIPWPLGLPVRKSRWRPEEAAFIQRGLLSGSARLFQGRERISAMAEAPLKTNAHQVIFEAFMADLNFGENLALLWDWQRYKRFDVGQVAANDANDRLVFQSPLVLHGSARKGSSEVVVSGFDPFTWAKAGQTLRIGNTSYLLRCSAKSDAQGIARLILSPRVKADAETGTQVFCPGSFGLFQVTAADHGETDGHREGSYALEFIQVFEDERPEGLTLEVPDAPAI